MFDSIGPALAAELAGVDPAALGDEPVVDAICGWERLAAWAAAGQLAALAELARRRRPVPADGPGGDQGHPGLPSVSEFAVDEVAAALRLSRYAAGTRLHVAIDVAERLPETGAALRRGELDLLKVRRIVEATSPLPAEAASAVERRVLPRAATQTVSQLRASLSRAVLAVDPADAEMRHQRAMADRRVCITPQEDGMAELWALLPADGAAAVGSAVDALARRMDRSGGRTMDNRRADALVELAVAALRREDAPLAAIGPLAASQAPSPSASPAPATRARPAADTARPADAAEGGTAPLRADVHVTVPAGTLLGLSGEPGELAGHGPIPASMARRLAADGTWRRILTDPVGGGVLDVGRRSYSPPAALADHVIARDRSCRFPGCGQPARRCDLDHTIPYPQGPTSAGNLAALCRHQQRLVQSMLVAWSWTASVGRGGVTSPV